MDMGFEYDMMEIIKHCPAERQTMLFSATMNTKVDDLVKLSLKKPVRVQITSDRKDLHVDAIEVAPWLEQEFVRVRAGNEPKRESMLLSLLTRTFKNKKTIVFFNTKAMAHRLTFGSVGTI